jgi:hypothetical protein
MIRTEAGLTATRESLVHLENALLDLTQQRAKYHPATFALIAAPIRDQIHSRRAEIDEYIGLTSESNRSPDEPPTTGPIRNFNIERDAGVFSG